MNKFKSFVIPSVIIILGILTFIIEYFTPFQSDDFNYALMSYNSIIDRYMTWSGRVSGHFLGILLMSVKSKFVLSIIQTLGLLGLVYLISQIPIKIRKQKFNIWLYLFVFSLYFIFHPDLGESTFWVVGSANYLWTNLIICAYLYFLFNYYFNSEQVITIKDKPLLSQKISDVLFFFLAFFSGLTNENTGPFVVSITLVLFVSVLIFEKKFDFKLFYYSLFTGLGSLILLLSPGNSKRLEQWEENSNLNWSDLSLTAKFEQFNFNLFLDLKYSFILLFFAYFLLWFFRQNQVVSSNRKLTFLVISILFAVISFLSIAILFLSPETPRRALSGSFIFSLIAIVFAYAELFDTFRRTKFQQSFPYSISVLSIGTFIIFYFIKLLPMYKSYNNQYKMQIDFIEKSKENQIKEIKIPRMFISQSLSSKRIDIDPFEDPKGFARYFGLEKVEFYSLNKDLVQIGDLSKIEEKSLKVSLQVQSRDKLVFILAFKDGMNHLYDNDHKIWKSLKLSQDSAQSIYYQLPPGKIEDVQIDVEAKEGQKFKLENITFLSGKNKFEIPIENLSHYFTPNKYIKKDTISNEFIFIKDEIGNVYPSFKATDKLKNELKKINLE